MTGPALWDSRMNAKPCSWNERAPGTAQAWFTWLGPPSAGELQWVSLETEQEMLLNPCLRVALDKIKKNTAPLFYIHENRSKKNESLVMSIGEPKWEPGLPGSETHMLWQTKSFP